VVEIGDGSPSLPFRLVGLAGRLGHRPTPKPLFLRKRMLRFVNSAKF
jgi:hypothetical protein